MIVSDRFCLYRSHPAFPDTRTVLYLALSVCRPSNTGWFPGNLQVTRGPVVIAADVPAIEKYALNLFLVSKKFLEILRHIQKESVEFQINFNRTSLGGNFLFSAISKGSTRRWEKVWTVEQ